MAERLHVEACLSDSMSRDCHLGTLTNKRARSRTLAHSERVVHLEQLLADALGAVWGAADHYMYDA